jgi:hypothetical protein
MDRLLIGQTKKGRRREFVYLYSNLDISTSITRSYGIYDNKFKEDNKQPLWYRIMAVSQCNLNLVNHDLINDSWSLWPSFRGYNLQFRRYANFGTFREEMAF